MSHVTTHVLDAALGLPAPGIDVALSGPSGEIIATGTTDADGYGSTVVQRAQFIVNTVRVHVHRSRCTHPRTAPGSKATVLGTDMRWCPACGAQLRAY